MEGANGVDKRIRFEDLSKEELVKKCKTFLTIIEKAKQSKRLLQEEIEQLKIKAENGEKGEIPPAVDELIQDLTQQKLNLVSTIEDLKLKNESLVTNLNQYKEEKKRLEIELNKLDNENIVNKKQITRLNDENDQLITHLDSLEKQIEELNKIGLDQQKQLLRLEEQNTKPQINIKQNEKIQELEKMLSISLEEIKRLKSENSVPDSNMNELNEKLRMKLKNYHSKIVKLAASITQLKADKESILDQFKTYTEQVKEWRDKLNVASEKFIMLIKKYEVENEELKKLNAKFTEQLEAHKTDDEKSKEFEEIDSLRKKNSDLSEEIGKLREFISELSKNTEKTVNENCELKAKVEEMKVEINCNKNIAEEKLQLQNHVEKLMEEKELFMAFSNSHKDQLEKNIEEKSEEIILLNKQIEDLKHESDKEKFDLNEKISQIEIVQKENESKLNEKIKHLSDELEKSLATEKQLAEKSSEEILKLVQEIEILTENSTKLQDKLDEFENKENRKGRLVNADIQTENEFVPTEELQEEIALLRSENAQLLTEMNEMNQELKERGENISKLEAHCEEIKKKIQIYETQANKNVNNICEKEETIKELQAEINDLKSINIHDKDEEITKLKNEIECLNEKINANNESLNYAESDVMSTSTISRTEEMDRLKDLEGSWEEKYGKLKSLAIKLKAKLKEQTAEFIKEKTELQQKLNNTFDTLKTLQTQHDKLGDELEQYKTTCFEYSKKIEGNVEKISSQDDIITKLNAEIQVFTKEKTSMETWKKQIAAKVQTLRKEVEEKKDLELKIAKLNADLEAKDEALKLEKESHRQTKNSLQHSANENKKNTVLNLEMQDYEKSVKDLSQKLEKKNDQITKLKGQIDSQKGVIQALRDQNNILEEKVKVHENDLETAVNETSVYKKKIMELENLLQTKEDEISNQIQQLETIRSQNEELSTELSKDLAEHQKIITALREEKETLYLQNLNTQQTNREIQEKLALREEEFSAISKEYDNYKIRAQSVLRQNQNRDIGLEEKLSGDVSSLTTQVESLKTEIDVLRNTNESLKKENESIKTENNSLSTRYKEVSSDINELKNQHDQLLTKYNQTLSEHNETVRSLKVHAETLGQCYRQQLSEQEVRHNREIVELQSKMEKAPCPAEVTLPTLPTMTREEGEGSESTDGVNNMPVSLEKLLGGEEDQKISVLKKQINEQESKLTHLTDLLADTEQDLAKHVQMNKVLKEEIRRQQRAVEREKHAENLEYLKNVVFKFITLSSGDERVRLVPVLNTILKLSPEETKRLDSVAKGDPGLKAWSSYLPSWSSPNKP